MELYEDKGPFCNNLPQQYACQQTLYKSRNVQQCADHFFNTNILGNFCKPYFDGYLCWAPAHPATTVAQLCPVISTVNNKIIGQSKNLDLFAIQFCDLNSTWVNVSYAICKEYSDELIVYPIAQTLVRYITAIGSSLSLVALSVSLFIFFYFKSLYCCRLRAHRNFCIALMFSLLVLIMYVIFGTFYVHILEIGWLCKTMLVLHMYFAMASINWMFVEGLLLHSRVTTDIFRRESPFKLYYSIGWGLPMVFVATWMSLMFVHEPSKCWKDYVNSNLYYIITIPILTALLINAAFLINVIRILIRKRHVENNSDETGKIKKAFKATALLFPLLGIPYLAFSVRPKDSEIVEEVFVVANSFLSTTQGLFFSILYCFVNDDVQMAVKNAYNRSTANRKVQFRNTRGLSQTSQTYLSDSVVTDVSRQRLSRGFIYNCQISGPRSNVVQTTVSLNPMNNKNGDIKHDDTVML